MVAMLPSFCRDSITVKRASLKESRGTKILDWSNPQTITVSGCSVQPTMSSRDFDGRTIQVTEEWTLYAPPQTNIAAGDRIEWHGMTFEVNGSPMPWASPTGRVSHVYARLSEWSG